ncbi:hypothetical protein BURMUCF2_0977 [Burkholderia multivorans CF2]|nr:hypothetical protein BURMUCF2_0977 [Burkholderia multivorans CF2]
MFAAWSAHFAQRDAAAALPKAALKLTRTALEKATKKGRRDARASVLRRRRRARSGRRGRGRRAARALVRADRRLA